MRAIDTNVLIRLITRDHERQTASAEAFIEKGAWVSLLVLTEAVWVLETVYERSAGDLAATIEMLLDHENLILESSDSVGSALEIFRSKPGLGFSDCLIVQLARKAGHLPLGTFDKRLAKVDGAQAL